MTLNKQESFSMTSSIYLHVILFGYILLGKNKQLRMLLKNKHTQTQMRPYELPIYYQNELM